MPRSRLRPALALMLLLVGVPFMGARASSHREAPLISQDPIADNTDLYAFRSPDNPNTITIIANYIPFESPEGAPNWFQFGENVHYEICIENDGDAERDIAYRFTFTTVNEDPSTFFNIRLGKQNLKQTYKLEKSTDNGYSFTTIIASGVVPPPNIGPRSIDGQVGLNTPYPTLVQQAIATAQGAGGEKVFCGPVDDPFFVDLGGIFDLGAIRMRGAGATGSDAPRDAVAGFNVHTISMQIPIATLQKQGKSADQSANILDPDFVIGVWASAYRPQVTTLRFDGGKPDVSGPYVQVSRLGMPLTNEAIIPLGQKDYWNSVTPYDAAAEASFEKYLVNPELALYMTGGPFGAAVPGLSKLNIQTKSLGSFNFTNMAAGLSALKGSPNTGTAFADAPAGFKSYLLRDSAPRSVDILPIFYTGVPNLRPYQLATGKGGDPLAAGKPFIHNFLPTFGDMLRLNMAVPPTPRNSPDFSSEGLVAAAALGLTDPRFNANTDLQNIPNMDGFPNGRRLEDDVTRIELQAVGGVVLAAIGLWYDDYTPGGANPVTPMLQNVLTFNAGPTKNDTALRAEFPFQAYPHRGYDYNRKSNITSAVRDGGGSTSALGISTPAGFFTGQNYPNPVTGATTLRFHLRESANVTIKLFGSNGAEVATIASGRFESGDNTVKWSPTNRLDAGTYVADLRIGGVSVSSLKINVLK